MVIVIDPKVDPKANGLQVLTLIDRSLAHGTPNESSRMTCSLTAAAVEGEV